MANVMHRIFSQLNAIEMNVFCSINVPTGYPVFKGTTVTDKELHDLYDGLKLNKVSTFPRRLYIFIYLFFFCFSPHSLNRSRPPSTSRIVVIIMGVFQEFVRL